MTILRYLRQNITMLMAIPVISIFSACQDSESLYCKFPAYFSYSPVTSVPTLHRACTSLGEFCTITYPPGSKYVIQSPSTPSVTDYIERTANLNYRDFILGLGGGLIIGLPSLPEMMAQESQVVCFDLCCPNCYKDYHITKSMTLKTGGISECSSCHRIYDLNSQGIVASGDAGRSLYRYYVSYYAPSMMITVRNNY